jgi:hypothetical protein
MTMPPSKVFVSHIASSPAEARWVQAFSNALRSRGLDVFEQVMDEQDLPVDIVGQALRESDLIVMVMSATTLEAPEFLFELGVAIVGDKQIFAAIPHEVQPDSLAIPFLRQRSIVRTTPSSTAEALLARLPRSRAA